MDQHVFKRKLNVYVLNNCVECYWILFILGLRPLSLCLVRLATHSHDRTATAGSRNLCLPSHTFYLTISSRLFMYAPVKFLVF